MTTGEAKELWARFKGQEMPARKVNVRLRLRKFAEFVANTLKDWTPAERELALEELNLLVEQIAGNLFVAAGQLQPFQKP